jgi:uncharacterized coiled-coil DUF342 family protein
MTAAQPDRLSRIEATLDTVVQRLDQTSVIAAENTSRFTELAEAMLLLSQSQRQTNQNLDIVIDRIDQMQSEIREMQSEVRGLQAENRRIIERVFGPE